MTEQHRKTLWFSLLDAARVHRYHAALADRYLKRRRTLKILIALFAILAATAPFHQAVAIVASVALLATLAIDQVTDHANKHAVLRLVAQECGELHAEWAELWDEIQRGQASSESVVEKNRELNRRLNRVTAWASDIAIDEKLNIRAARQTYEVLKAEHASA